MVRRSVVIVGSAGLGVAAVVAGALFATIGTASAATPCGAVTPSSGPSATATDSATPTDSASPTATATGTASPTPTPTNPLPIIGALPIGGGGQIGGSGQGTTSPTPTATGTDQPTDQPTDSASPTTSPVPFTFAITPHSVTKGKPATAYGKATPGCTVDLWAYTRPGTSYKKVRSTTSSSKGVFSFTIYPGGNTRAFVRSEGAKDSSTDFVDVREVVSIKATKLSHLHYRFAGGVGPAELQTVTVYTGSGQKIGSVATDGSGAWHLDHAFAKGGTSTFYAVATKTQNNGAGTSPKISVTIS